MPIADFDKWLGTASLPKVVEEEQLPNGVWQLNGNYYARCRCCGLDYELVYDPMEFTEDTNVCNGSQSCVL